MSAHAKTADKLARQFFKLSVEGGAVLPDRVAGVLQYLEKHRPANPLMVLRAYHRLVAAELGRSRALVEHAGPVSDSILQRIAAGMTKKYGRPVSSAAKPNASLIAGLRVRVGDDVHESSLASRLAGLGTP
jgi:F-type H+-transporting ATPase subunit delta